MTDTQHELAGGCSCGIVRYRFLASKPASELQPRACQCHFCRPRDARYVGDAGGRLLVTVTDKRYLYAHSFGTFTADFIHCARCNDLVYVTSLVDGQTYALVEQHSLENAVADAVAGTGQQDIQQAVPMDFDGESVAERLERRAATWIPELEIEEHV